jgi:hypothetical protein
MALYSSSEIKGCSAHPPRKSADIEATSTKRIFMVRCYRCTESGAVASGKWAPAVTTMPPEQHLPLPLPLSSPAPPGEKDEEEEVAEEHHICFEIRRRCDDDSRWQFAGASDGRFVPEQLASLCSHLSSPSLGSTRDSLVTWRATSFGRSWRSKRPGDCFPHWTIAVGFD